MWSSRALPRPKHRWHFVVGAPLLLTVALGCRVSEPEGGRITSGAVETPAPTATPIPKPEPAPQPAPLPPRTIALVAVGDVLPHRAVKATAAEAGWQTVFGDVTPLVRGADLAFANLESPVAPEHHKSVHGEVFNAPASLVDGLKEAGFDVLSMANNHVYDQGPDGLLETFSRVESAQLSAVGAGPTCERARSAVVREVGGVRIAWLAAADLVNIDSNSTDDGPCAFFSGPVCSGDCGPDRDAIHFSLDRERLYEAVVAARARADFVVMSFHWGDEYRTAALPEYPLLARDLVNAGVDLVIGHHPHVLQQVEWIDAEDGRRGLVAYSLGNFVSNMAATYVQGTSTVRRGNTRDGALLRVTLQAGDDAVRIEKAEVVPLWTDNNHLSRGDGPHRVVVRTHEALGADPNNAALLSERRAAIQAIVGPGWLMPGAASDP